MEELFEKAIKVDKLPTCHPKILALKKGLQNARQSIDEIPREAIQLNLRIPVKTAAKTISRN